MVGHWKFPEALRNTLLLAAVVVPVQLALALAMASIVTKLDHRAQRHPLHLRDPARPLRPRRRADLARDLRAVGLSQQLADGARHHRPAGHVPRLPEQARALHRRRARRDLAGDGDHDGDPRRRHGADPEGILRGGGGVRRRPVEALHQGHAADAAAEPADRDHPARHPRLRGLRRRRRARPAPTCRC